MKRSSNGKISRLPHPIREQLHLRLRDGEQGGLIVAWLNSLPEVHRLLAAAFDGRPISGVNLSEWKKRNHPAWLLDQAALAQADRFMAQASQLAQAGQGNVSDHLATFVAARYALASQQSADDADDARHWQHLRALCHDVVRLRRGDHYSERLRLKRRQLALSQLNTLSHIPQ